MYVQENYSNEVGSCWLETYRLQRGALSKWARNHWTHSNCPPGCMQRALTAVLSAVLGERIAAAVHRSARPAVQWDVCHTGTLGLYSRASASYGIWFLSVTACARGSPAFMFHIWYLYMYRLISSKSNFTTCIVSRVSFQTEILLEQNSSWAIHCFVYKQIK